MRRYHVAFLLVALFLPGCLGKPAPAGPTAAVEGERWTLDDLFAHLRKSGAPPFEVYPFKTDAGNEAAWMVCPSKCDSKRDVVPTQQAAKDMATQRRRYTFGTETFGLGYVERMPSAVAASDETDAPLKTRLNWGRFAFGGDAFGSAYPPVGQKDGLKLYLPF